MSVTVIPIPGGRLLRHKIQKLVLRYDKYLNFGGQYVENNSTLAVPVQINLYIKFDFVYVNSPRETYYMNALRMFQ